MAPSAATRNLSNVLIMVRSLLQFPIHIAGSFGLTGGLLTLPELNLRSGDAYGSPGFHGLQSRGGGAVGGGAVVVVVMCVAAGIAASCSHRVSSGETPAPQTGHSQPLRMVVSSDEFTLAAPSPPHGRTASPRRWPARG